MTCETCEKTKNEALEEIFEQLAEAEGVEGETDAGPGDMADLMKAMMGAFEGMGKPQELLVILKSTHKDSMLPKYMTPGAAGFDIATPVEFTLNPGQRMMIDTGLNFLDIPDGWEIQVRSRSGLAVKDGIFVLNAPGTIDDDYRGKLGVILYNSGDKPKTFAVGDRIAQGVFAPVFKCSFRFGEDSDLRVTERNEGGFGSTDKPKNV